jgi:ATP-binding cassette subfamily B protein
MSPPQNPRWADAEKVEGLPRIMGRLFRYIGRYRFHIYLGVLFSFLASVAVLVAPQYLNELVDLISDSIGTGVPVDLDRAQYLALVLIGMYILALALRMVSGYLIPSASEFNGDLMRKDLGSKISRLPLRVLDRIRTGDVMSRFVNDAETVRKSSAECIAHTISALVMVLGSLAMMFMMEWRLAIVSIIPSLAGILLIVFIIKRSQRLFREQARNVGEMNTLVEETYYGLEVVSSYNGTRSVRDRFGAVNRRLFYNSFITRFISNSMPLITGFIGALSYVIVCIAGSMMVLDGEIGYGVVVAFIIYVKEFSEPLGRLSNSLSSMQNVAAASERVFEFLDLPEMDDESALPGHGPGIMGRVEFDHVCFSYVPGKEIIHDMCLTVEPGSKIAIVGPTGSGKTTIANLLMRFYDVDSGRITLDGKDIREMTREDVRSAFCMILQDSWMFEGSIRDNITFGIEVDDGRIMEACEAVGVDGFIRSLPDGLDTIIGESNLLSAGQRQQINIIRAMVRNSPLLILDEATSAMDTYTEKKVQMSMDRMMESHTSFVIAHRLSTIEDADMILVIRNGDIVEKGSHSELLERDGFYRELYDSQFDDCERVGYQIRSICLWLRTPPPSAPRNV